MRVDEIILRTKFSRTASGNKNKKVTEPTLWSAKRCQNESMKHNLQTGYAH